MVDLLRTIKNVLDAHGAWLFGGAVAAGLVARRAARKRSSFDADWFQVTCYGCGRSGFSDEFAEVMAPDGRDAYRCVRCDRPDLFRQSEETFGAEAINSEIILMQAILPDGTVAETSIDHVDQLSWPGHLLDESVAKGGSMDGRFEGIEMPAGSGHHCVVWSDPGATEPNAEASRLAGQPVFGTAVVYSVHGGESFEAEATNACPHCEGAAGFPREFYYQPDRIEVIPCGTCLTQGRCPGCMEIYTGLTRDVTPEQVFLGTGCTRCGYSESDAREARRTARRWTDLVDNPAAARFLAEDDGSDVDNDLPAVGSRWRRRVFDWRRVDDFMQRGWELPIAIPVGWTNRLSRYVIEILSVFSVPASNEPYRSYNEPERLVPGQTGTYVAFIVRGSRVDSGEPLQQQYGSSRRKIKIREGIGFDEVGIIPLHELEQEYVQEPDPVGMAAEDDYGVGAVWMSEGPGDDDDDDWSEWNAERYDPNTHGAFLPAGSVKRFLSTIPLRTPFFVEFQKSNGDLRSMNAIFTKPFDADGMAAGVLEVFPGDSSKRSSFKRFRVDRVVTLYRL